MTRRGLVEDEGVRSARLLDAQARAAELFAAIEPRGIIAPGVRETEASDAIRDLAAEMFGVSRHLEVHLVVTDLQIGGFFEELLDIGPGPALRG